MMKVPTKSKYVVENIPDLIWINNSLKVLQLQRFRGQLFCLSHTPKHYSGSPSYKNVCVRKHEQWFITWTIMNYEFVAKFLKIHVGSDDKLWINLSWPNTALALIGFLTPASLLGWFSVCVVIGCFTNFLLDPYYELPSFLIKICNLHFSLVHVLH